MWLIEREVTRMIQKFLAQTTEKGVMVKALVTFENIGGGLGWHRVGEGS